MYPRELKNSERTDGQLLSDVASGAAEEAFQELVRRHGAMVLAACRRMLDGHADADDAAQAVFLILWKKAGRLRKRASVANWLHRVARNVCRNAARARAVRSHHEREAAEMQRNPPRDDPWNAIKDVLDDELDRLPDRYRLPLILFYLEGRKLHEIAAIMEVKLSTIGTRLTRSRQMLHSRLTRRGITISASMFATVMTNNAIATAAPVALISTTTQAALVCAAAHNAAECGVAVPALSLANAALQGMFALKVKFALIVALASVGAVSGGFGILSLASGTGEEQPPVVDQSSELSERWKTLDEETTRGKRAVANDKETKSQRRRASEVIERFRRNRARFQTLRVVEHRVEQRTKEYFLWLANGKVKDGTDPGLSKEERAAHSNEVQWLRNLAKTEPAPRHYRQDFWTDRLRFQSRIPRGAVNSQWEFSDNAVTPATLVSSFKDSTIFSFMPSSKPSLRIWIGFMGKGETSAIVANDLNQFVGNENCWFPSFVVENEEWGTRKRHPIDKFFDDPVGQLTIVGEEKVGNVSTVVIRNTRFFNTGLKNGDEEIFQQVRIATAWIDPECGYLPRRIELHGGLALNGRLLPESDIPMQTVTVSSLRRVDQAGFYPAEGTIEDYVGDPSWKGESLTPIEWMKGKTQREPMVIGTKTTWTVNKIEANREMSDEMFAMRFPDDVAIVDADTGNTLGALPSKPAVKAGEPAPDWIVDGWTDGVQRRLSDYKGQVLVLEFWGKWCGPCLRAIPAMNRLQDKYREQQVRFLAIHTAGPDIEEVRQVAEQHKYALVSGVDAGPFREAGETAHRYGCDGFPTTVVIGRDGIVSFNSGDVPDGPEARQQVVRRLQDRFKRIAATLDIAWPPDQDSARDELYANWDRINERLIVEEIDKVLKQHR